MRSMVGRGSYQVSFPKARFNPDFIVPLSMEIVQEASHHDAAVVRFKSRRVDWRTAMAPGTPIKIAWKSRTSPESFFFGYVTNVRPLMKHDDYYRFDVYAVGASRALRQTGQEVWKNLSAPQIASKVARRFGLRPVVLDYPLRKPQTLQSGRSYWEVLSDLADQIGYALWVDGTTLYFMPISSMIAQGFQTAPVLSAMNASNKSKKAPEYAILNFESIVGLNNESSGAGDQVSISAAQPSGEAVSSRRAPGTALKRKKKVSSPYVDFLQGRAVYSKKDADALAQGRAEKSLMAIDSHVESEGTPALRPFSPVYLETQSRSTSGWWAVKSVRHRMGTELAYVCESVLSTDSVYPSTDGKPRGLRNLLKKPPTTALLAPSRTTLRPLQFSPVRGRSSDIDQAYEWVAV